MNSFKTVAAGLCALSLAACETMGERELTGTVVGGALGGLVGSQVGGDDRTLATGLGAALGAYVGNRIGRRMDDRAAEEHARAAQQALWYSGSDRPYAWRSQDVYGEIVPTSAAYRDNIGRSCRRFTDRITFEDGSRHTVSGVACLNRDGRWEVIG